MFHCGGGQQRVVLDATFVVAAQLGSEALQHRGTESEITRQEPQRQ